MESSDQVTVDGQSSIPKRDLEWHPQVITEDGSQLPQPVNGGQLQKPHVLDSADISQTQSDTKAGLQAPLAEPDNTGHETHQASTSERTISQATGTDLNFETQVTNGGTRDSVQASKTQIEDEAPSMLKEVQRDHELSNGDEEPVPRVAIDHERNRVTPNLNAPPPILTNGNGHSPELLYEIKGPSLPDPVPTLWESFVESVVKYPSNLAVASVHQKGEFGGFPNIPIGHDAYRANPYLRWSFADFATGVLRVIQALQAENISEGCLIFTFCTNSAEFVTIVWAAIALGCTMVPIHSRVLLNREEVLHIIKNAKATATVDRMIGFAQNSDLAEQVVDLGIVSADRMVVMDDDASDTSWRSFEVFLPKTISDAASDLTQYSQTTRKWALIIFTSGTTALPKGVVLDSYRIDRIIAIRRDSAPVDAGESCFLPLPNNHAFFHLFALMAPGSGGGIVLPSPTFQPQNAPEIMELEQCAHFPMSPTMVHAIKDILTEKGIKFTSLKNISTGGAKLSIEFIQACLETIGSKAVEVIYGSTEGCVTVSTGMITSPQGIIRNGDASVGVPRLGCTIKICRPGSTEPLPWNTEGNLHYATSTRCNGYAGGDKPDVFYTDDQGREWFATGDAATINEEGMVFIVGRIKDMIIRGGVNIAPAAMEFVLAKDPYTSPFNIQIVGKLDPIAGEVPIGVSTKPVTLDDIEKIQGTILDQMGPIYEPEEILTLQQLGLEDFPRAMIGKVQKGKLTEIVRKYLYDRDAPKVEYVEVDDLADRVQKVWIRTIGHGVKSDAEITSFADSITIMRIRDRFKKDLGADISLADMLGLRTVDDQVRTIREQSERKVAKKPAKPINTTGPTINDMVHMALDPKWFQSTQTLICDKISKYGLGWDDIQEITPASDFTSALIQADVQNTGWSWKFAFLAKEGIGKQALRKAIEVFLTNNPMLPSFMFSSRAAFGSDITLHVMPKPTTKLFDAVFRDYGSIPTRQEFANEVFKPYEYEMAMVPNDVLINFLLYDVEDTGRSGTVMVANHAAIDATYMQLMFDDFDKALGGAEQLEPHISYKTWADSYYCLRTSFEAQVMVNWQVRRLEDLADRKLSVFPPTFDPHDPTVRVHRQDISDNGFHTDFHVPGITNLRGKHILLSAPTIVKAAWSLLNIYRNKTSTALFSNLQADRRRFPFVPKALEMLSPAHTFEASRVAGPTLQDVVNIIPLYPEEPVLEFIHRVANDQEELNKYAAAPLKTVLKDIGPTNAEVMIDVLRSQIFNWTPGLGALQTHNPNENYEPVSSFIRPKLRLVINVDVGGADDETCYAQIKSPLFDKAGLRKIAEDLQDILVWVCDERNWGRRTGDFTTAFRGDDTGPAVNGYDPRKEHYL